MRCITISFIKNIADGRVDERTHNKFVRYSKGTFEKEPFKAKLGSSLAVKSGYEYVDDLLLFIAARTKDDVSLSGFVVSRKGDIASVFEKFGIDASARGKKYTVKGKLAADDFTKLLGDLDDNFLLLALTSGAYNVKVKKSLPKPGSTVVDFASVKLPKSDLDDFCAEFLFDAPKGWKSIEATNTYLVEDVVVPKEYEKDMEMARKKAKRVGKVLRKIVADGKETVKEYRLEA